MSREEDALYSLENNQLALDDAFDFKCKECGKCCKNREDILLSPRDLFNIAKILGRTTGEIIKRYCESYVGESSRVPLVRLQPVDLDNRCPLLFDRHCIVHKAKPTVCALFPLGRGYTFYDDATFKAEDPVYFVQPVKCGSKAESPTVRSWLEKFGVPLNDEFQHLWSRTSVFLSVFFMKMEEENKPKELIEKLRMATFSLLYLGYDTNVDLLPQFSFRAGQLKGMTLMDANNLTFRENIINAGI